MGSTTIYLGNDRENGEVELPIAHLAVFGQTRRAGKTTSLRTIVNHAATVGVESLIFRTGTGEISFPGAHHSTPYFRARLDWQAVEAMLWTFLSEKPKIYRPIIMRAVRGARSLEDVHRNVVTAGKKSTVGWVVDRTYELDTYFQEILPWLEEHELAQMVYLRGEGTNVVDLEGWPKTVQQLVVASTLEALMASGKRARPLIVVLPEAREFIPHDRATPVKLAADRLARMGAKLNLFLWVDSQALTGVDQQILRNFAYLLQGVQTSDIEIRRVSKALEVPPKEIKSLRVGDFVLHTPDGVRVIHIPLVEPKPREENMDEKERKQYEERLHNQGVRIGNLERELREANDRAEANAKAAAANAVTRIKAAPSFGELVPRVDGGALDGGARNMEEDNGPDRGIERVDLHIRREVPNLTVHIREVRIDADGESNPGRAATLVASGFFDQRKSVNEVAREFRERGWGEWKGGSGWNNLDRILKKLAEQGFLRNVDKGYVLVAEARDRIRTVAEAT